MGFKSITWNNLSQSKLYVFSSRYPSIERNFLYWRKKGSLLLGFWSELGLGGALYMFLSVFSDFEFFSSIYLSFSRGFSMFLIDYL